MPLSLLAPLVIAGVAIVIFAVHYSGGSRVALFRERRDALAAFGQYLQSQGIEASEPQWSAISEDGMTALVETRAGDLALLRAHGKQPTVRMIGPGEVKSVSMSNDSFSVTFKLKDWTWPKIVASFEDTGVAGYARQLLENRRAVPPGETSQ